MDSNPPAQGPAQQVPRAGLAIRGRRHQEGRQRKAEDREDHAKRLPRQRDWQNAKWSALREKQGKHAAPSEREAITRKAATGWRATRRLTDEEVGGCWFS